MDNVIAIVVLLVIVGLAARYVIRAKKKGKTCIGCPDSGKCAGHCAGCRYNYDSDNAEN